MTSLQLELNLWGSIRQAEAIQQLATRAECLFEEWNQQFEPTGLILADEDTSMPC